MAVGAGSGDWPWSALGIAETADKAAIRAAYDAKRAQLDAGGSISAFADLTAARGKALFLASEMQREAARKGQEPLDPQPAVPEPPAEPEPEPEPEPELEPEPEPEEMWEPAGRFADETDILDTLPPDPHGFTSEEPYDPAYAPIEDRDFAAPPHATLATAQPGESQPGGLEDTIRRYSLNKYGAWWLGGFLLLLGFCAAIEPEEDNAPRPARSSEPVTAQTAAPMVLPDYPWPAAMPGDARRAERAARELFGEAVAWQRVRELAPALSLRLADSMGDDSRSMGNRRGAVRRVMLEARTVVSREHQLDIARLYEAWLLTAREAGEAACMEVTDHAFLNGVPQMRDDWIAFERSLAATLLLSGELADEPPPPANTVVPDWAIADAASTSGLSAQIIVEALADRSLPTRCDATIAVLGALLARSDEAPAGAFQGL